MQYIKITTNVNLSSGLSIPPDSIVVVSEGYLDIKAQSEGLIPAQIATLCYASIDAFLMRKQNVVGISDFPQNFTNLSLTVEDYETQPSEALCINALYDQLIKVYPNNLEICSTTLPIEPANDSSEKA